MPFENINLLYPEIMPNNTFSKIFAHIVIAKTINIYFAVDISGAVKVLL